MSLPTSIWVHTRDNPEPIALTGVTDWRWCKWREPRGTYRDNASLSLGTATIKASGSSTLGDATGVPVYGLPTDYVGATFLNAADKLKYAVPDEAMNIAPRQKWEIVSGLVVAVNGASIPSPGGRWTYDNLGRVLAWIQVAFTVSTSTNILTINAGSHLFVTGDVVALTATTYPLPATAAAHYKVVMITDYSLMLVSLTGELVDWTTTGSGVQLNLVTPAPRIIPSVHYVTGNATTDVFTMSVPDSGRRFITGDLVRLGATTVPTGLTLGAEYTVIYMSGDDFQIANPTTGAVAVFSGVGSGVFFTMVTPADSALDKETVQLDGISGLMKFPTACEPRLSTVAPS